MDKTVNRTKHTIDATGKIFGRLATHVATLLRGKHKPQFRSHIDIGDWVEIKNIALVKFSGKKLEGVIKYRFSGFPGGLKEISLGKLFNDDPESTFRRAVSSMLPKNRIAKTFLKRLTFVKGKKDES